jgi:hypothetical protein
MGNRMIEDTMSKIRQLEETARTIIDERGLTVEVTDIVSELYFLSTHSVDVSFQAFADAAYTRVMDRLEVVEPAVCSG